MFLIIPFFFIAITYELHKCLVDIAMVAYI
jgi:hypothetical protein